MVQTRRGRGGGEGAGRSWASEEEGGRGGREDWCCGHWGGELSLRGCGGGVGSGAR